MKDIVVYRQVWAGAGDFAPLDGRALRYVGRVQKDGWLATKEAVRCRGLDARF